VRDPRLRAADAAGATISLGHPFPGHESVLFCLHQHLNEFPFMLWPRLEIASEDGVGVMGAGEEENHIKGQDRRKLMSEV
jgi:hypothetical protein